MRKHTEFKPTRVVGYVRVSTDTQDQSVSDQAAAIAAYAASAGLPPPSTHTDAAISGSAPLSARPGLFSALTDLSPGSLLVVTRRDRLSRDAVESALLERHVHAAGARVLSLAGEGTSSDSPADVLMRRMVDAVSEYERAVISARIKSAMTAKRSRGERVGRPPYGYRVVNGTLSRCDAQHAVCERVAALHADGMSLSQIGRELFADGIKTRSGKPLSKSTIRDMLRRDFTQISDIPEETHYDSP